MQIRWVIYLMSVITGSSNYKGNAQLAAYDDSNVRGNTIIRLSNDPSYVVVASQILRPGSVYSVAVSFLKTAPVCAVRASISRDGVEVSSAESLFEPGDFELLLLKIPTTRIPGSYQLRIVGTANEVIGASFNHSSELQMMSRFLTIIIHTNRPVYNAFQKVLIRVMVFTLDMKPYSDSININILDPKGYVMTGFPSVQLNIGVASVAYDMAEYSALGWWNVQVDAFGQEEYQRFLVEKFDPPKLEVFVFNSEFVLASEDAVLSGTLMSLYWTNSFVMGNATLRLYVDKLGIPNVTDDSLFLREEVVEPFEGLYDFEYNLRELHWNPYFLVGKVIRMEVLVHDQLLDLQTTGYGSFYVMNSTVQLQFIGPKSRTFKAGMLFQAYVVASCGQTVHLTEDQRRKATITVQPSAVFTNGHTRLMEPVIGHLDEDGVLKVRVETLTNTRLLTLNATYDDGESVASAHLVALNYHSTNNRSMYIQLSSSPAEVGQYCILHVQSDFYLDSFNYVVISKGIIITTGTEDVDTLPRSIKTISIPVSPEMVPNFRVLVYHMTPDGYVIADSVTVPVKSINNGNLDFRVTQTKDKSGFTVELGVIGKTGGFVGFAVQDADTFCHKCGADLTPAMVMENLYGFDDDDRKLPHMKWMYDDLTPDATKYYEIDSLANDDQSTFALLDMMVFTDARVFDSPDRCDIGEGYLPCMNGQCYHKNGTCDSFRHCSNGFDEFECFPKMNWEALTDYRIFRKNRVAQFYDASDGDWGWASFNTDIKNFVRLPVANRPSNWIIFAFRMDEHSGLSMLDVPTFYEGIKPFFINAEMPTYCRRGEQIGIRVDAFNNEAQGIFVTVHLLASDDYKFVHVEQDGVVESYAPRTSHGEHEHLIWIEPMSVMTVYMPIVATRIGEVEVTVEARTAVIKDSATFTLLVEPDGVIQNLHTSLLLDLKTQPQVLKFLNINVTETPIIPYDNIRLYLFDSPKAHASIVGDAFGPPFPNMPVTPNDLLRKPEQTAEPIVFTFGANLWMLHYLRLTNQLNSEMLANSLVILNYYYAYVMQFQNDDGSFSMWKGFEPSVWLTAAVVRVFEQSRFSDWENDLAVDVNILVEALQWLLDFQTPEGAFVELYDVPFNFRMQARSEPFINHPRHQNIPLTAFVLITLCEVNNLPGDLTRVRLASAKHRASRYLEKSIAALHDPYEVAIVAYALTMANSVDGEFIFQKLDSMKREQEGGVYWSTSKAPLTEVYLDNQRYFLQAHLPHRDDALSVETTSYALLVYVAREGLLQENIVRWLNTRRTTDGGFVSTQDSLVAYQALTEYSFRARMRDITDMSVRFTISSMGELDESLIISEENMAHLQTIDITKVWGHVDVAAKGSGMAVLQLDVSYSIDHPDFLIPPADRAFDLAVTATYHGRNNSKINVNACQRWLHWKLSPTSGVAVFEMDLPTGYFQHQPVYDAIVDSRTVRNLRNLYVTQNKVFAFFRLLDEHYTCVNFTLDRWWPVANLSQYIKAKVYDYYSPELYNETVFSTYSLYGMDICQACGSYQCPYCHYYSSARQPVGSSLPVLIAFGPFVVSIIRTISRYLTGS